MVPKVPRTPGVINQNKAPAGAPSKQRKSQFYPGVDDRGCSLLGLRWPAVLARRKRFRKFQVFRENIESKDHLTAAPGTPYDESTQDSIPRPPPPFSTLPPLCPVLTLPPQPLSHSSVSPHAAQSLHPARCCPPALCPPPSTPRERACTAPPGFTHTPSPVPPL